MKHPLIALGLGAAMTATAAQAVDHVLLDTNQPMTERRISSTDLGIRTDKPFTITTRLLHGGRQEGVSLVEIDTGAMVITVVPTRGMNVLKAVAGNVRLGWDSPVREVVNPAFIELNGRDGLGWLEGFNELVTRCGYEWVGHPGKDTDGQMLTLHGLVSNIPASRVVLSIDEKPPYTIRLKGLVREQAFKKVDFVVDTELRTEPGATTFTVHDRLTNQGDYAKEYQALYHTNFGPPLLEEGARFAAPVREVSPFNDYARQDLATWQTYRGPTRDYDEMVYNVFPYGDASGNTLAVLHDAAGNRGISMAFNVRQLPAFSLWKNTDTSGQGYVTGLEPGTSFSYNRRYQRGLGLVPTINPRETKEFVITYSLLGDRAEVAQALKTIEGIRAGRKTTVRETPLVALPK
ncbi:MAG: aldose 1-epimerase family protein [Lautropia sp.]|nr:aldose 1-epimerase family protein [Lautropia sp.]